MLTTVSARDQYYAARDRKTDTKKQQHRFSKARRGEATYAVALRKIARHVGEIIEAFTPGDPAVLPELENALRRYSDVIRPWARNQAARMLADVATRNEKVWAEMSRTMARQLHIEIKSARIGDVLRGLMDEQVILITSLPLDAAQRVHELTIKGLTDASRFSEMVEEIQRSGEVTASRATLIARTETGRASTALTQARSLHLGSEGYVWRAVHDPRTRQLHRDLDGTYHRWDDPPIAGEAGERSHPGAIYNCFPGSTLAGPVNEAMRVFRARYCGQLVVLVAGDAVLEVTPNHPILTPTGWVAASLLNEGDYVVQSAFKGVEVEHHINNR